MPTEQTVFDRHYHDYLNRLKGVDLQTTALKLGLEFDQDAVTIPFFNHQYNVSTGGITDTNGQRPSYETCVILSKYLLLCPDEIPRNDEWVSFRDLKEAGPLTTYFANDIERAMVLCFGLKLDALKKAANLLGGYGPKLDVTYDMAMQFDALPKIPIMVLFNDKDEEFEAKCSVLFERRVESYLDAECIAMTGRLLYLHLKNSGR